ncbi:hypothetical protein [Actinomadura sp. WMMA1423]|uniref:hypothetical protein n=1 Tax=Actinomadura sp. WMMA1423 TaxID=2591108 RepID=UPI001146E6C9|nr:hypothetical protein [Actinomadura sp. WMMA1423]
MPSGSPFVNGEIRAGLGIVLDDQRLARYRNVVDHSAFRGAAVGRSDGLVDLGDALYRERMPGDDGVVGDDPLADGMALSLRLRRDFTVTDADRLLTTARRLYRQLNPDTSAAEASSMVTGAADALFVILEHAGLLGDLADGRLLDHAADGLAVGGWRAQIVINEPAPLSPDPRSDCLRGDEVFALPSQDGLNSAADCDP